MGDDASVVAARPELYLQVHERHALPQALVRWQTLIEEMDVSSSMKFAAFISYSHACDGALAPAIQAALQRLGRPWYKLSAMRVFRDKAVLSASPSLWSSIESALAESQYFVLLASPDASQSSWVSREVSWWLTNRGSEKLLIALTEGEAEWDPQSGDFDWQKSTALPQSLTRSFSDEPLYVDVRWARSENELSLRHARFRAAILDLASAISGVPKDELDSDDIRQHRRTTRLAWAVGSSLLVLSLLVILFLAAGLKAARALNDEQQNVQQLMLVQEVVQQKMEELQLQEKAACDSRIAQVEAACQAGLIKHSSPAR